MKKRGFGAGKWNGFGGKIQESESMEAAARREFEEESGVKALTIEERGQLIFEGEVPDATLEVHIFAVTSYEGEAFEGEEMRPRWFPFNQIPYDSMWLDDRYWLPLFIEGKKFIGTFFFDGPEKLIKHQLKIVDDI